MLSRSIEDTFKIGELIGNKIKDIETPILLYGNLGAGKTTLTKGIGFALGVNEIINSPTFTILKTYKTKTKYMLNHLDLYRLDNIGRDFDLEDYIDTGISVIEWPDNIKELLPKNYIKVTFNIIDENEREIIISKIGDKYDKLICDTSTSYLILLLANDNKIIDKLIKENGNEHSKYLTHDIKEFLSKNNLSIKEIDSFIVGYGPGSYTGLRISCMELKTFAYVLKKPLYYISSLILLSTQKGLTIAYLDARRNNIFLEVYDNSSQLFSQVVVLDELENIEKKYNVKAFNCKEPNLNFDLDIINSNIHLVEDLFHFIPNYLRITEAEENRDKKS